MKNYLHVRFSIKKNRALFLKYVLKFVSSSRQDQASNLRRHKFLEYQLLLNSSSTDRDPLI